MTKEEMKSELLGCLRAIQESGGREVPPLTDGVCPLLHLPGFDSLNAEEVSSQLEVMLKCRIGHHRHLFYDEKRPRTIAEMVEYLYQIAGRSAER